MIRGHMPLLRSYPFVSRKFYKHGAPTALKLVFQQAVSGSDDNSAAIAVALDNAFNPEAVRVILTQPQMSLPSGELPFRPSSQ